MIRLTAVTVCFLLACGSVSDAAELIYRGPWHTTNRKLDGTMTCVVTRTDKNQWRGQFYGTWQGVDFDYTVTFSGPSNNLRGDAIIDGARYEWRAWIGRKRFRANFGGDRYQGSFDLVRVEGARGEGARVRIAPQRGP